MKRKLLVSISAIALSLCMNVSVFASTISVTVNGANRVLNNADSISDVTVVDGVDIANALDLKYNYDSSNGTITLYNDIDTLVMKVNNTNATLNGESVTLPVAPKRLDDNTSIQVPLRFVSESFDYDVIYDNQTNEIELTNESNFEERMHELDNVTDNTKIYTYDEALQKSINNSSAVTLAKLQFDELDDELENIQDQIDSSSNSSNSLLEQLMPSLVQSRDDLVNAREVINNALELEDDSMKAIEEGLEISLITALNTNETAKINYLLAEDALNLQKINLYNTKTKYSLGMVSDTELKNAQSQYDQMLITLDSLQTLLDSSKRAINVAMGVDPMADTYVEYDTNISYDEYDDLDVDYIVSLAVTKSITVRQAENDLESAEEDCETYLSKDDKHEKERALSKAKSNLLQAKKDVENNVRSSYDSLTSLVNNQKTLEVKEQDAINQYNNAVLSYNAGYITMYELKAAELALTSAECDIVQNELNYSVLIYQMEHPDLF